MAEEVKTICLPPQMTYPVLFTFFEFSPTHPENSGSVNQLLSICIQNYKYSLNFHTAAAKAST